MRYKDIDKLDKVLDSVLEQNKNGQLKTEVVLSRMAEALKRFRNGMRYLFNNIEHVEVTDSFASPHLRFETEIDLSQEDACSILEGKEIEGSYELTNRIYKDRLSRFVTVQNGKRREFVMKDDKKYEIIVKDGQKQEVLVEDDNANSNK